MKVALVHYWLVNMRGGEKVLESLCDLFPDADIYTHVYDPTAVSEKIRRHKVYTSFISRLPFATKLYQNYLPFMPRALEQIDLSGYDLVISLESGPAKGVLTDAQTPHICYCHTPMRYLWDFYQEYLASASFISRIALKYFSHGLRQWDRLSADRVDYFVANSQNVASRIKKHYRRPSEVVYPPVNVDFFRETLPSEDDDFFKKEPYYLFLGQLVPYKRLDLAIEAFNQLDKNLYIIGHGPQENELRCLAGSKIKFLKRVSDKKLRSALHNCQALIFPGEEDFGIVPVEANAAGKPVIAYGKGGALETVIDRETGLFFYEPTKESLVNAVQRFERIRDSFDPCLISKRSDKFSNDIFTKEFMKIVERAKKDFKLK